jgi:hypothetical protein
VIGSIGGIAERNLAVSVHIEANDVDGLPDLIECDVARKQDGDLRTEPVTSTGAGSTSCIGELTIGIEVDPGAQCLGSTPRRAVVSLFEPRA